ncbi:hypothetical protein [Nostoc sp.]|uniref:hypothetical protein n=1 Tax=Nostoc sp. TaxID=1180 RepID=UPI002FF481CC
MTKTTDAIASLTEGLNSYATTVGKLLDASASDHAKLDEAHSEIDTLKAQLLNSVDDEATSQTIEQLAENLKAVAAKALSATPA